MSGSVARSSDEYQRQSSWLITITRSGFVRSTRNFIQRQPAQENFGRNSSRASNCGPPGTAMSPYSRTPSPLRRNSWKCHW